MLKAYCKAKSIVGQVVIDETGSLKDMIWVIGSGLVMVLIVVVFMKLAPDTAESMWDSFIDYANDAFGL